MTAPYGVGCSCPCLGVGTPEHAPGALCLPPRWSDVVADDAAWVEGCGDCGDPACPNVPKEVAS